MGVLIFLVPTIFVIGRGFPDTLPGRLVRDVLAGRWRKALPGLAVAAAAALLLLSAPELAPLAAGLDLSLMADILLAASVVTIQLNVRRIRHTAHRIAHIAVRTFRGLRRRRARRTVRRQLPPAADDDAPRAVAWA